MARKKKAVNASTKRLTKRAQKNQQDNQLVLRQKIAAGHHHTRVVKILDELQGMGDGIRKRKTAMTEDEKSKFILRTGVLKTQLDGQFKLMKKYIPDLQAMQIQDPQGNDSLVEAVAAWAKALEQ